MPTTSECFHCSRGIYRDTDGSWKLVYLVYARSDLCDARDMEHPHVPIDDETSYEWTPDRATLHGVISMYGATMGTLIPGERIELVFPSVGSLASWAEATSMTDRVTYRATGSFLTLTSKVTAYLDLT